MKNTLKKLSCIVFVFCFLFLNAGANEIDKYIKDSNIDLKSTTGVYIFNKNTSEVIYKKNEEKLLNPASILKVLNFGASYITLGENYKFQTSIHKDANSNLYLKLSGDTLLSQGDLNNLFSKLKTKIDPAKINNIYIDDTIIDKTSYPASWMREDVWPNQRAITPYIIDRNLVNIAVKRSSLATKIDIIQNDDYKFPIINELRRGENQSIKIVRIYGDNSPVVNFQGTVSKDEIIRLPVLNPEINFQIKLRKALDKNEINYFGKITARKTPKNTTKIAYVEHSIADVSKDILYNSDNFSAEVVFRAAAAKFINYSHSATLDDAINMFQSTYGQFLDDEIKIADGSGVSRYNLISAKFAGDCMAYLSKNTNIETLMPSANQGTLRNRMLFLENNLRAKTGTLAQISSILGTLKTLKGEDVVFCIIIQNCPKRKAVLKNFEDTLLTILYRKY